MADGAVHPLDVMGLRCAAVLEQGLWPSLRADADVGGCGGTAARARLYCRFVLPCIRSITDPLTYSVLLLLKRRDRTLGTVATASERAREVGRSGGGPCRAAAGGRRSGEDMGGGDGRGGARVGIGRIVTLQCHSSASYHIR